RDATGHAIGERAPGIEPHAQKRTGGVEVFRLYTAQHIVRLNAQILSRVISGVIEENQHSALLYKFLERRRTLVAEPSGILGWHGSVAVSLHNGLARLIGNHDRVESLFQVAGLNVGVEKLLVCEAELVQKPPCPALIHA